MSGVRRRVGSGEFQNEADLIGFAGVPPGAKDTATASPSETMAPTKTLSPTRDSAEQLSASYKRLSSEPPARNGVAPSFEMSRLSGKLPIDPDASSSSEGEDDAAATALGSSSHLATSSTRLLPMDDTTTDSEEELILTENGLASKKSRKGKKGAKLPQESFLSITLQIFFPFLIAGLGMVGAGLVLDAVQHWDVFLIVNELFILVPALLGLKGNLEMTLASRLSTHANLGNMDTKEESWSMVISNLALVQCQAIVVGLLASLFAVIMGTFADSGGFEYDHGLLLCAASLVTASVASFSLGLVMVSVILASRRFHINPDNVATPIAASLGDLITLALLSWIASVLWADLDDDKWLAPLIIGVYLVIIVPLSVVVARTNPHTKEVLRTGWTPVLLAMLISSAGGVILDKAVKNFKGIAVFQPVMNGVGGNLVAVQASRMSTYLHSESELGTLPEDTKICINPFAVFFGRSVHSRTALILLLLVVPGHLLFTYTISLLKAGHTSPTPMFLLVYLCAAVIQLWILLHSAHWLINWMWRRSVDPDNSAIPYLTAMGDLLGGFLLLIAFLILYNIGDKDADVGD